MKPKWSVLAVYEDAESRQLAVQFCDCLVQRFWAECALDLSWCDWKGLAHPVAAREAGKKACDAELVIVALSPLGTIPGHVKVWLELAFQSRGEREGVLVGLPEAPPGYSAEAATTHMYLRKLAHQAGMDYLTAVPENLPTRVPESAEACNQRATQVTSVLDSILRYSSLPPRML